MPYANKDNSFQLGYIEQKHEPIFLELAIDWLFTVIHHRGKIQWKHCENFWFL